MPGFRFSANDSSEAHRHTSKCDTNTSWVISEGYAIACGATPAPIIPPLMSLRPTNLLQGPRLQRLDLPTGRSLGQVILAAMPPKTAKPKVNIQPVRSSQYLHDHRTGRPMLREWRLTRRPPRPLWRRNPSRGSRNVSRKMRRPPRHPHQRRRVPSVGKRPRRWEMTMARRGLAPAAAAKQQGAQRQRGLPPPPHLATR